MSTNELLRQGLRQFAKHPLLMLALCGVPHAIGFVLLVAFVSCDPSQYGSDYSQMWQAMSPLSKALVFLMIPLNSWLPFALGQVGITRIAELEADGELVTADEPVGAMLRSSLKIVPLFFLLSFIWAIGVQVILVPGILIAWQIGFAPMILSMQNSGMWQAVKVSSRIASQTSAQSLTLWVIASFSILVAMFLRVTLLRGTTVFSIGYIARFAVFVLLIAAVEAILNSALAQIYLSSRPAHASSAAA